MSPLTYKVFNLYFSIRCGTYITHTCTQHSPSSVSQAEAFYLLVSSLLVSPQMDRHACTAVVAFCANGPAASVVPFVERDTPPQV